MLMGREDATLLWLAERVRVCVCVFLPSRVQSRVRVVWPSGMTKACKGADTKPEKGSDPRNIKNKGVVPIRPRHLRRGGSEPTKKGKRGKMRATACVRAKAVASLFTLT